jgi:prepilin-type N-terminal cleavage/methylation domain-containing protein
MQRGFTLIEIILVSAMAAILVLAAVPFFQSFSASHQLDVNADDLLSVMRRAQSAAMGGKENSKFGVYFTTGPAASFIFFRGDSYVARDTEYDEVHNLPQAISLALNLGGPTEIAFSKLKGTPSVIGGITLANNNGETKILSINQVGRINVE